VGASRAKVLKRALGLALGLALVATAVAAAARGVGGWLMVADPLEPASAIVVLSGHVPFRAMEAAALYRQQWAPEVWLTHPVQPSEEAALRRLGIDKSGEEAINREILNRLGVPSHAIRVLESGVVNTAEEVRLIASELERVGAGRVILVTSKPHSRRVRATWRTLVGRHPRAVIRYAAADPYDPSRWWRRTSDVLAVSREALGLVNVWAGFPVQPDRR
jgi:uncharacterized SAM-binding protein YcdF (DUF218 family)